MTSYATFSLLTYARDVFKNPGPLKTSGFGAKGTPWTPLSTLLHATTMYKTKCQRPVTHIIRFVACIAQPPCINIDDLRSTKSTTGGVHRAANLIKQKLKYLNLILTLVCPNISPCLPKNRACYSPTCLICY